MKRKTLFVAIAATGLMFQSCSQQDDKSDSEESAEGGSGGSGGGGGGGSGGDQLAGVSSIGDLKIGSAFALDLPAALEGGESAAGLYLAGGRKSQEACQMGQSVKESVRGVKSIANFFCHLEIEKDQIEFGKKYKLTANGQDFARIFVDNTLLAQGKISIGFCSQHEGGEENRELIVIDGLSEFGPKGSLYNSGKGQYEGKEQTWATETAFDMSAEGLVNLVTSQLHSHDGNTFRRKVELAIAASGLTNVKLAASGSWSGNDFSERGAALFNGEYGAAVYQNAGVHQGNAFSFARRAYFSEAGDILTASEVPESVIPQVADVPAFLAADFAPSLPAGWVADGCQDFESVVDINPSSPEHMACDSDDQHRDCWDDGKFQAGTESVTIE